MKMKCDTHFELCMCGCVCIRDTHTPPHRDTHIYFKAVDSSVPKHRLLCVNFKNVRTFIESQCSVIATSKRV